MTRITIPLVISSTIVFCSVASAEEPVVDAAKQSFQLGIDALKAEDFPKALAAFEESYRLRSKPSVLYNIGMCQYALSMYVEAIETFEKLLSDAQSFSLSQKRRDEAEKTLELAGERASRLEVRADDTDLQLLLDSRVLPDDWQTKPLLVNPGPHVVEARKPKYEPFQKEIDIEMGKPYRLDIPSLKPKMPTETALAPSKKDEYQLENPTASHTVDGSVNIDKPVSLPSTPPPPRWLFTTSIVGLSGGAGGLILAGAFTYKWHKDYDHLIEGNNICNDDWQTNCPAYHDYYADRMRIDEALLIAGYAVGGTLAVAGAILMFVYQKRTKRVPAATVIPGGVSWFF